MLEFKRHRDFNEARDISVRSYETVINHSFSKISAEKPYFGKSYSTRNILTRILQKTPSFGKSYSTRNILTRFVQKSHSFGKSYRT